MNTPGFLHTDRHTTDDGKLHIIKVGFFCREDHSHGFFSDMFYKMASWWTGRSSSRVSYVHVELRFSDGYVTSITQGSPVHYERRLLSNEGYRGWYQIKVSPDKEAMMQEVAQTIAARKATFNRMGMYCNFLPFQMCGVYKDENKFFCSEYITQLLHLGGFVLELEPSTTSPNQLYQALREADYAKPYYNRELEDVIKKK